MSAGIPGLGLGGLFFVISALIAPGLELARTVRGESSAAAWRQVGRQFAIAVTMVAMIDLSVRATFLAAAALGMDAPSAGGLIVLPLGQIGIAIGVLAAVLAAAKLAQLMLGGGMGPYGSAPAAFSPTSGEGKPLQRERRRSADGQEHHEQGRAGGGHLAGPSRERDGRVHRHVDRQVRRRGSDHGGQRAELRDRGDERGS